MYNFDNILGLVIGIVLTIFSIYLYKIINKPKPKSFVDNVSNILNNPKFKEIGTLVKTYANSKDPNALLDEIADKAHTIFGIDKRLIELEKNYFRTMRKIYDDIDKEEDKRNAKVEELD